MHALQFVTRGGALCSQSIAPVDWLQSHVEQDWPKGCEYCIVLDIRAGRSTPAINNGGVPLQAHVMTRPEARAYFRQIMKTGES